MLNRKISQDESVAKLSLKATLLYTWIIPHADIKGRLYGDPAYLKGNIIPHVDEIKISDIKKLILEMVESKLILYYGEKVKYIELCGWENNQTVYADRESKSEIPEPTDELLSNSCVTHGEREVKEKEKDNIREREDNTCAWDFDILWERYPRKIGRRESLRHFVASVKTDEDYQNIKKALENYIRSRVGQDPKYTKHGSTWFLNWRDWVNIAEGSNGKSNKYAGLDDSEPAGI